MENVITMTDTLKDKLSPDCVRTSPFFHAILGAMLGADGWTKPSLDALVCTSDGFILGQRTGDIGFNDFLCDRADLVRNCKGLAEAAELTEDETAYLLSLVPSYEV